MNLSQFDFDLPGSLVALRPVFPRSAARLLVFEEGQILDRMVRELPSVLRSGDRLVFNDTRVLRAQLSGSRVRNGKVAESAQISVNLARHIQGTKWLALAKPARRLQPGDTIIFSRGFLASVAEKAGGECVLDFKCQDPDFASLLDKVGTIPLPPYIASRRDVDEQDANDYQTVFARRPGAVAAPTAALHFDEGLLDRLRDRGIGTTFVTLHVGAGTFLPIKDENLDEHCIHSEWGEVSPKAASEINSARELRHRVIAVGTTSLRLVETASFEGRVSSWSGSTDLFIRPGYKFKCADGLITNFHPPKSTLMVLVAALIGLEETHKVYAHAIRQQYRFYSYGDCSLFLPQARDS